MLVLVHFFLLLRMVPVAPLFVLSENLVVVVSVDGSCGVVGVFLLNLGWTMLPRQGADGSVGLVTAG